MNMNQPRQAVSASILVVDDSEIVLDVVRGILEDAGYEVHTHNSPFQLLQTVRTLHPALILLDVNMPALSGNKALEILTKYKVATPVVFYSDRSELELLKLVETTGAAGYIKKTADPDKFLREVKRWVH